VSMIKPDASRALRRDRSESMGAIVVIVMNTASIPVSCQPYGFPCPPSPCKAYASPSDLASGRRAIKRNDGFLTNNHGGADQKIVSVRRPEPAIDLPESASVRRNG
jgi:hypothetical protein